MDSLSFTHTFTPSPTNTRTRYSRVQSLAAGGVQLIWLGRNKRYFWKTVLAFVWPKKPTLNTNGASGSFLPGVTQGRVSLRTRPEQILRWLNDA
jgi:hypothetical protein